MVIIDDVDNVAIYDFYINGVNQTDNGAEAVFYVLNGNNNSVFVKNVQIENTFVNEDDGVEMFEFSNTVQVDLENIWLNNIGTLGAAILSFQDVANIQINDFALANGTDIDDN